MQSQRHVRLFRQGRNQALCIPRELELQVQEATIGKDGERLLIEPVPPRPDLATVLAGWAPCDEPCPGVVDGLLPLG